MEEQPKNIPNCLKKCRRARGLKQKDVIKIMGIKSASIISRWENGICLPSTMNAIKLAVIYHVMVDAFFIDLRGKIKRDIHKREEKVLGHKAKNERKQ